MRNFTIKNFFARKNYSRAVVIVKKPNFDTTLL